MILTSMQSWARKISQAVQNSDIEVAKQAYRMPGVVSDAEREVLDLLCDWVLLARLGLRLENGETREHEDFSTYFGLAHYAGRLANCQRQAEVDQIQAEYRASKLLTRAEKNTLDILLPWVAYGRDCYARTRMIEAEKAQSRQVDEVRNKIRG